jgi:hydroxymethylpyrimidine/phosphomethylpyrimidine kinase
MAYDELETAALTIAGSDSCGGAGIQADLKTFNAFGVHGASVVTAVTAQNTLEVRAAEIIGESLISAQLDSVLADLPVKAVKTGMLGSPAAIRAIAERLDAAQPDIPLVMDPVMIATSGAALADAATIAAMRRLMARAALVTPNLDEASALAGMPVESIDDMRTAAGRLLETGCKAVLVKGGHLPGEKVSDLLLGPGLDRVWTHATLQGRFHGTGCTLSAAITAGLARGEDLVDAADKAMGFVQKAMRNARRPRRGQLLLLAHYLSPSGR